MVCWICLANIMSSNAAAMLLIEKRHLKTRLVSCLIFSLFLYFFFCPKKESVVQSFSLVVCF